MTDGEIRRLAFTDAQIKALEDQRAELRVLCEEAAVELKLSDQSRCSRMAIMRIKNLADRLRAAAEGRKA